MNDRISKLSLLRVSLLPTLLLVLKRRESERTESKPRPPVRDELELRHANEASRWLSSR